MKIRLLILILFVFKVGYSQEEKLEDYKIDNIKKVIDFFKQKNIDSISTIINFPLNREYPITCIKNEKEFKQRFHEVFDKILIEEVANSTMELWSEVGWRGIMLDNGLLWIDSYDGKIVAVNYQSEFEKQLKKDLIDKEKENLHYSLKLFESPIYKIQTKNYLIRIDELSDYKYRYACWKLGEKESSTPDLIIQNGQLEHQGSGGNHVFTFINNNYIYRVYRNIMGWDNSPDITLEIEKNGKIILTEDGAVLSH